MAAGYVGAYVLTAEILITGSIADEDAAMDENHIGIHRPSGSTGSSGIAATRPQVEARMAEITRGFGGRRRDDTVSGLVSNVAQLTGPVRA